MSDQDQPGGMHCDLQPHQNPPAPQTTEVVVDDSGAQPTYANFCRVTATPEEVILDFGLNPQPFAAGGQVVKANHRIVMSAYTTKRLLAAIGTTIQRHEQTFGAIELDVNRRVSGQGSRIAPARLRAFRPARGDQAFLNTCTANTPRFRAFPQLAIARAPRRRIARHPYSDRSRRVSSVTRSPRAYRCEPAARRLASRRSRA